jgi:RHS repeat-associated protein
LLPQNQGTTESPAQPTSYTCDQLSNLTQVSQGSQTRTFVYDSLKRLTSASNPESGTVSYSYDSNGNLTSKTDARSITSSFTYDALNRVITKSYSNDGGVTPPVNYYYDNASLPSGAPASFNRGYATGRLVSVTYGSSSSNGDYRGYDELGRVVRQVQQTDGVNYLTEATYYLNSAMATETYPSVPGASDRRTVSYSLDSAARLSSLSSSATSYAAAASLSSISYEPHGGLTSETLGNTLIHQMSYNTRLQTTAIKLGTSGNPTSVLNLTYSYGTTDNNGNLKSHVNTIGSLAITDTFSYDSLNRLSSAVETSTAGGGWTETNGFDRYGNRWIDLGGGNQSLTFSTTTNRITTSGYSYDSVGNLIAAGGVSYGYDAENHLITFNSTTGYKYDGEGRRVRKLIGENTRFIYGISGELVAEFNGSTGNLQKEYVSGGGMMAVIDPSAGTRYTTSDHLGSPRVVTDSSGNVVSRHDYMPFGVEIGSGVSGRTTGMGYGASDGVRDQFTGQQRDTESGLDYFGARYYSAAQGRFTSPDPLMASARAMSPQTWNRYSYVLNKPMNLIDPSGLTSQSTGEGCSAEFDRCDGGDSTNQAENDYAENVQHQMNANIATHAAQAGDWDTFNELMAKDSTLVTVTKPDIRVSEIALLEGWKEDSPIVGRGNIDPDDVSDPPAHYTLDVTQGHVDPSSIFTVSVTFANLGSGDWDPTSGKVSARETGRWKLVETPTAIPPIRQDVSESKFTLLLNIRARDLKASNLPISIQVSAFHTSLYPGGGRSGTERQSVTRRIYLKLLIAETKSTIREAP